MPLILSLQDFIKERSDRSTRIAIGFQRPHVVSGIIQKKLGKEIFVQLAQGHTANVSHSCLLILGVHSQNYDLVLLTHNRVNGNA